MTTKNKRIINVLVLIVLVQLTADVKASNGPRYFWNDTIPAAAPSGRPIKAVEIKKQEVEKIVPEIKKVPLARKQLRPGIVSPPIRIKPIKVIQPKVKPVIRL